MNSVRDHPIGMGLPHSEICGSMPALGSPQLIAKCYVLHRLLVPRHPRNALKTLDHLMRSGKANAQSCLPTGPSSNVLRRPKTIPFKIRKTYSQCQRTFPVSRGRSIPLRKRPKNYFNLAVVSSSERPAQAFAPRAAKKQKTKPAFSIPAFPLSFDASLKRDMLVEPDGIEPTTSCVQSRRSPS